MPREDQVQDLLASEDLLQRLAAAEHERWAHWQQYVHDRCEPRDDGALVIPAKLVARWTEQITTPYADLSAEEQRSDQEQVQRYLPIIVDALGGVTPER